MCLSGQLRTFADVWPQNLQTLSAHRSVNYLIETWSETGSTWKTLPGDPSAGSDPSQTYTWESLNSVDSAIIESILPGASIRIHKQSVEKLVSLDSRLGSSRDELKGREWDMFVSTYAMLYLMQAVERRRQQQGEEADWVVRIRPDWVLRRDILKELDEAHGESALVFFDSSVPSSLSDWGHLSDVCFAARPSIMALFQGIFDSWRREILQHGFRTFVNADPAHSYKLFGESSIGWFVRHTHKIAEVSSAEAQAGFILREGVHVRRRSVDSTAKQTSSSHLRPDS